ncbi:hypothetical protein [Shimazuella kribbensis]|uniref:hypothetical protein n=1 Tax=Shimazuella kribbensis TaxID=139808 RepID=UPI00048ECC07|nr:hypothetical protein [Shimazuella kribbensis]
MSDVSDIVPSVPSSCTPNTPPQAPVPLQDEQKPVLEGKVFKKGTAPLLRQEEAPSDRPSGMTWYKI